LETVDKPYSESFFSTIHPQGLTDMHQTLLANWLLKYGMEKNMAEFAAVGIIILTTLLLAVVCTWIVHRKLLPLLFSILRRNKFHWDDTLIEHGFFRKISWFTPLLVISISRELYLNNDSAFFDVVSRLLLIGMLIVATMAFNALLSSISSFFPDLSRRHRGTIRGYTDIARILTMLLCGIFLISIITDRSPWGLLSLLGGLTAIIMLLFKDVLLGFVANIQLSTTDMVQVGDWIEMPQYGADGDVIDISIHCVRVQNWDKTITSIPTYGLISNSFKNWRGMSESGGRRIKRAIHIDIGSIHFVSDDEINELLKISILKKYLGPRKEEIESYNKRNNTGNDSVINGRNQTNIGIFRAYIQEYLRQHPQIHSNMTFLVRQLQPTAEGIPLEIYVFSKDQVWANYEAIQADIFDHLLAALPHFGLRAFQNPTGADFKATFAEKTSL
jgi:miniconductance mechanosensitive channel